MKKYLIVDMEWPRGTNHITERIQIDGTETEEELRKIAEEAFFNHANYGYEVVGKQEGPADELRRPT